MKVGCSSQNNLVGVACNNLLLPWDLTVKHMSLLLAAHFLQA